MVTTTEVAKRLAAKVFKQRGNHSEVHLSRAELEGLFTVVAVLTLDLKAQKDGTSEAVAESSAGALEVLKS